MVREESRERCEVVGISAISPHAWIGIQLGRRLKQIAERTCTNFQNLFTFTPKFTTNLLQIYVYDDLRSS